ncbi:filamin-a [Plakobranchus ocellatus]|uniref:Filamin-a n=1 Tax=Plakobranchus ocellatus TaxID=259542 RepID=A0AAV3ZFY6_9GAST|nr:filamin-a [Plakobranchus ocellatus]
MDDQDPTSADAEWKKIQQNTFTRWVNDKLKTINEYVYNVETDLSDGILLIKLLEVLSHKKLRRYVKRPTFKAQRLENASVALKFIEDESIRLVNIDASDIVKGNLKLILGLIWTLILKYSISIPLTYFDGENNMTPKQALLKWVREKVPDLEITDFTRSWDDGRAIAALVNFVEPRVCPDWRTFDPCSALENATKAMSGAEELLHVPMLMDPADIVNPKRDELSVMTYVSLFVGLRVTEPVARSEPPDKTECQFPANELTEPVNGAMPSEKTEGQLPADELTYPVEGPESPEKTGTNLNHQERLSANFLPLK